MDIEDPLSKAQTFNNIWKVTVLSLYCLDVFAICIGYYLQFWPPDIIIIISYYNSIWNKQTNNK